MTDHQHGSAAVTRPVPVDDAELCVEELGDPADPTVLLVSGAAASMDWWDDELCARLVAAGRHVVRYDHRDTGRSTTSPVGAPAYDADTLGSDCLALVEDLGPEPVHLIGVSMGGGIAQVVALRSPDLVASLTLVSTTAAGGVTDDLPPPVEELQALWSDPAPDPDWSDAAAYADWVVAGERDFAGTLPVDETRLRDVAARVHRRSHDVAAAANHWAVVGQGESELDVHDIAAPTLVVHGSHDPLFPLAHGQALAAAIPGARLLVLDGGGHQVPHPATWDVLVPELVRHTGP